MHKEPEYPHTNALIDESSPYLLQHAHNPVDWLPWGEEALQKAKEENKPIIVSIGYSACHWCHVMEKESFEKTEVAEVMNADFVCIKVDREERPDVDQVFMDAVQLMRKQGGWPLNCVATPDGKPVFGGTYFPKENWIEILGQLRQLWHTNPEKFKEYGDKLAAGMQGTGSLPQLDESREFDPENLKKAIANWMPRTDKDYGGPDRTPKFPMPVNYTFLLHYGLLKGEKTVLDHVETTLDKLAGGGIFDQVNGGFARYSTDKHWKVPHFEKMLYDNAQLIGLYAEANRHFKKSDYLRVVRQCTRWLEAEMQNGEGGYFSALDADSENEEGKYYVFHRKELEVAGVFDAFAKYFHTGDAALWEGKLIPVRRDSIEKAAARLGVAVENAEAGLAELCQKLYKLRKPKTRPATDDKTICSWNAMLAEGFLSVAGHTGDPEYRKKADAVFQFIERELLDPENQTLSHTWKNGRPSGVGFLEDYAFLISAYLKRIEVSFELPILDKAKQLALVAIDRFYSDEKGLFSMSDSSASHLVSRPLEITDNVIPSGNTTMAQNLHKLNAWLNNPRFTQIANRILNALEKSIIEYPEGCAHAADLYLRIAIGSPEIVICGKDAEKYRAELAEISIPNSLWAVANQEVDLPIFAGRFEEAETRVYICQNQSCRAPLENIRAAIEELKNLKTNIELL